MSRRSSPHDDRADEELDRCLDAVIEILRTKAWERFAQNTAC